MRKSKTDRNDYPPDTNMTTPTSWRTTSTILTLRPWRPVTGNLYIAPNQNTLRLYKPSTNIKYNEKIPTSGSTSLWPGYHSHLSVRAHNDHSPHQGLQWSPRQILYAMIPLLKQQASYNQHIYFCCIKHITLVGQHPQRIIHKYKQTIIMHNNYMSAEVHEPWNLTINQL